LRRVGTGQGAQSYGHGLYFAENPQVARSYREELTDLKDRTIAGTDLRMPSWVAKGLEAGQNPAELLADFRGRVRQAQQEMKTAHDPWNYPGKIEGLSGVADAIEAYSKGAKLAPAGRMYEVDIRAHPDQLLNWDRPVGEGVAAQLPQSLIEKAQKEAYSRALAATSKDRADELWSMVKNPAQAPGEFLYRQLHRESYPIRPDTKSPWGPSGATSYEEALDKVGGDKSLVQTVITPDAAYASQTLKEAGIPGIKYLDQGSRSAGSGSSNYVMFDPSLIDIVKKYGVAAVPTMGAVAAQDQYGAAQ